MTGRMERQIVPFLPSLSSIVGVRALAERKPPDGLTPDRAGGHVNLRRRGRIRSRIEAKSSTGWSGFASPPGFSDT